MFTNLLRITIVYIVVLTLVRVMGKRQIGELQPFELVIMLIFADIATIPMTDNSIPLLSGIIPIITLVFLQFFFSLISRKSLLFQSILNGKPVIVIDSNGIIFKNLKALNMSITDLQEALRSCQVNNFDEVEYAIVETTGKMSVVMKKEFSPITLKDLNMETQKNTLPIILIDEGKFNNDNLRLSGLNEEFIVKLVKEKLNLTIKDVLVLNLDNAGKMFLQSKTDKATILNIEFNGGQNW